MGRRPSVALATSVDWPELPPDDAGIAPALRGLGIDAEPAIWTDPRVDWERFDAIVIRSCWDYHDQLDAWLSWLERLERGGAGARLHNPAAVLRWNARKTYLMELAQRGIPVVPTVWLDGAALASVAEVKAALRAALPAAGDDADELVAKPAVSAGARGTLRLGRAALEGEGAAAVLTETLPEWRLRSPVLVQPFLAEIAAYGEWSLLFFDGQFSHAVLKLPARGDFRVQERHGGRTLAPEVPPALLSAAREVLRVALPLALGAGAAPLLYARVDMVVVRGAPVLMELEVIEPALFLEYAPADAGAPRGAEGLARAIAGRVAAT